MLRKIGATSQTRYLAPLLVVDGEQLWFGYILNKSCNLIERNGENLSIMKATRLYGNSLSRDIEDRSVIHCEGDLRVTEAAVPHISNAIAREHAKRNEIVQLQITRHQ